MNHPVPHRRSTRSGSPGSCRAPHRKPGPAPRDPWPPARREPRPLAYCHRAYRRLDSHRSLVSVDVPSRAMPDPGTAPNRESRPATWRPPPPGGTDACGDQTGMPVRKRHTARGRPPRPGCRIPGRASVRRPACNPPAAGARHRLVPTGSAGAVPTPGSAAPRPLGAIPPSACRDRGRGTVTGATPRPTRTGGEGGPAGTSATPTGIRATRRRSTKRRPPPRARQDPVGCSR